MTQRTKPILDAAERVFLRYGVKRTTMNDIAQEAGVSRQTLYNAFANKDEVLRSLIRAFNERALAAIHAECASADTLEAKLDRLFEHMTIRPFDILNDTPNAEDLIEGINAAARAEIASMRKGYEEAIAAVLGASTASIEANGLDVTRLSEHVYCAAKGAKLCAASREELSRALDTLKRTVMHAAS